MSASSLLNPKGFLKYPRQELKYRPVDERLKDWNEVTLTKQWSAKQSEQLQEQASRCMDCGVPFCQSEDSAYSQLTGTVKNIQIDQRQTVSDNIGCPVDNLIPEWNALVALGQWQQALQRLHATNNFPEFTGQLCPAPCESSCVLGINNDPVTIRNIESAIVEYGFQNNWIQPQDTAPIRRLKKSLGQSKNVAIVGSGPAGLAAAQQLVRMGHEVTVFEKNEKPGGLLRYGIPSFKLDKKTVDRRLQQLVAEGVRVCCSTTVGKDISWEQLEKDYHAVGVAIGAETPRDLQIQGRNLKGIHFAMDYLRQDFTATESNLSADLPSVVSLADSTSANALNGEADKNFINAKDKHVIIIGGGDTGSDALGTALRQSAKSVLQFEILPRPPELSAVQSTAWPFWPMAYRTSHAHEEGEQSIFKRRFERRFEIMTKEFLDNEGQGRITHLKAVMTGTGEEILFPVDLVILAMGFAGVSLQGVPSLQHLISRPSFFIAGDARRGASLIVWAIQEGRQMAEQIDRYQPG